LDVNSQNYEKCLEEIVSSLAGKVFNVLTKTGEKSLKYCRREMGRRVFSKNGQVSVSLKPGGSIAWNLNVEVVGLEKKANGDIVLTRTFKTGRKKIMTITQNPI